MSCGMDQPLHVIFMVSACALHQHEGLCVTFAFAAIAALPRCPGSASPKPQVVFATSPSSPMVSLCWKNELRAQILFSDTFLLECALSAWPDRPGVRVEAAPQVSKPCAGFLASPT